MKKDKVKKLIKKFNKCSTLLAAKNIAELCETMETSYKLFSKLTDYVKEQVKRKKSYKIMLLLKRFLLSCKNAKKKFENSTTEETNIFSNLVAHHLSIFIELAFITSCYLDDSGRCDDITDILLTNLRYSPEYLLDAILRVIYYFTKNPQPYSYLYWKVWQIAEENLTERIYLKCLLLAKYWICNSKQTDLKPFYKSVKRLTSESLSLKRVNKELKIVGIHKIKRINKKKMTNLIWILLKADVRKSLKKILFGKNSKSIRLIPSQGPSDKGKEISVIGIFDRQGVSKEKNGNHVDVDDVKNSESPHIIPRVKAKSKKESVPKTEKGSETEQIIDSKNKPTNSNSEPKREVIEERFQRIVKKDPNYGKATNRKTITVRKRSDTRNIELTLRVIVLEHRINNMVNESYKCPRCKYCAPRTSSLTRHFISAHVKKSEKMFLCTEPGCRSTFCRKDNRDVHVKNVHRS